MSFLPWYSFETEDGIPRTGYAAARDRDVGYPRDRVYEDQLGRAAWRDGDGLGGGGDLVRFTFLTTNACLGRIFCRIWVSFMILLWD